MGNFRVLGILWFALLAALPSRAQTDLGTLKKCSTETVNGNCTVVVDRRYPLTLPTFQMRTGARITVIVINALPFETLSLDLQSAQALVGTDQTAGLVTAASAEEKAFVGSTGVIEKIAANVEDFVVVQSVPEQGGDVQAIVDKLQHLHDALQSASQKSRDFYHTTNILQDNSRKIYLQLQEIVSPLPQAMQQTAAGADIPVRSSDLGDTPNPWDDYPSWRLCLLHELVGTKPPATCPGIDNLVGSALDLQSQSKPGSSDTPSPIENDVLGDLKDFDDVSSQAGTAISQLTSQEQAKCAESFTGKACKDVLSDLVQTKQLLASSLSSRTSTIYAALAGLIKDLQSYAANIYQAQENPGATCTQPGEGSVKCETFGMIYDPIIPARTGDRKTDDANRKAALKNSGAKLLGRQVVFSVNAVNEISTSAASVPSSQQKKSIATITVLYADPIFEVSTGAFFSFQPSRSFANQTLVTQSSGTPVPGNVVITETKTLPTVEPFAAANWRLGHDFAWFDHRRGAFYFTTAVGLNPVTTTTDFGIGPSISWRSLVFSPLFQIGRDVHLTQGEFVGEVWCNSAGASGSIPKCSGNPPSPSTVKYWRGAFALGISIRVASVFSSGSH